MQSSQPRLRLIYISKKKKRLRLISSKKKTKTIIITRDVISEVRIILIHRLFNTTM